MNNCTNCGRPCDSCKPCHFCGCAQPVFNIEPTPANETSLSFNVNGETATYDFAHIVKAAETDTSFSANSVDRVYEYSAEKHTDTITAAEMGKPLHLADLGDVDATDIENGSMLTYYKDSNCGEGCEGINNRWVAWNALDEQVAEAQHIMVFDASGKGHVLATPDNPERSYILGWKDGGLKWLQATEAATPPTDDDGKKWPLYEDPDDNSLVYVRTA